MATNLNSDRISNFPSTKRASVNKLMTENSVTRLINRLIDLKGYIITNGLSDVDFTQDIPIDAWNNNNADLEFVIRGYYFNIPATSDGSGMAYLINSTGFNPSDESEVELRAGIFIDKTDKEFPELYGQDSFGPNHEYLAITFYTSREDPPSYPLNGEVNNDYEFYYIPIVRYMQQDNGSWGRYVPLDSLFKFNSKSISDIDGGEIIL